jgi:hypothetical protein
MDLEGRVDELGVQLFTTATDGVRFGAGNTRGRSPLRR